MTDAPTTKPDGKAGEAPLLVVADLSVTFGRGEKAVEANVHPAVMD
jgi:hypothetical protein